MVRKKEQMLFESRDNMRGGDGAVGLTEILTPEEMMGKGRLYSKITLKPGCSIGRHRHDGEAEIYYILSGSALAHDNDTEVALNAGDMLYTGDGSSHDIKNSGGGDLVFMALILYS